MLLVVLIVVLSSASSLGARAALGLTFPTSLRVTAFNSSITVGNTDASFSRCFIGNTTAGASGAVAATCVPASGSRTVVFRSPAATATYKWYTDDGTELLATTAVTVVRSHLALQQGPRAVAGASVRWDTAAYATAKVLPATFQVSWTPATCGLSGSKAASAAWVPTCAGTFTAAIESNPYYGVGSPAQVLTVVDCVFSLAMASATTTLYLGTTDTLVLTPPAGAPLPPDTSLTATISAGANPPATLDTSTAQWNPAALNTSRSIVLTPTRVSVSFPLTVAFGAGGTPSNCRVAANATLSILNRTMISAALLPAQHMVANAPLYIRLTIPFLPSGAVIVTCPPTAATIAPVTFGPATAFTQTIACVVPAAGPDWRLQLKTSVSSHAVAPEVVLGAVADSVKVSLGLFSPPVLQLFGAIADMTKTITVRPTAAVRWSAALVVTITAPPELTLSNTTLTWLAGDSSTLSVAVTAVAEASNLTVAFAVASVDAFGAATTEAAGNIVLPANAVSIDVNRKLHITLSWPDPAVLIVGRPLVATFTASAPPPLELTVAPTGGALSSIRFDPPACTFVSPQTSCSVTAIPHTPVAGTLVGFNLSGLGTTWFAASDTRTAVMVQPPIAMVSTMVPLSLTVGAVRAVSFYPAAAPQLGTVLLLRITCTNSSGATVATADPSQVPWVGPLSAPAEVLLTATAITPPAGVLCTGVAGGNATGFANWTQRLYVRPKTLPAATVPAFTFPGETFSVTIHLQYPPAGTVTIRAACAWVDDGSACDTVLAQPTVTVPPSGSANTALTVAVPGTSRTGSMRMTFSVSSTEDELLPQAPGALGGDVQVRARRWVRVVGLPATVFEGDQTQLNVSIEELPDEGEWFSAHIEGNPVITWQGSADRTAGDWYRPLALQIPAGSRTLAVTTNASSAFERNRFETVPALTFALLPKLWVTASALPAQLVATGSASATITLRLSRAPTLESCTGRFAYDSHTTGLLRFDPDELLFVRDASLLQHTVTVEGLTPGAATQVRLVVACHPRELAAQSAAVTLAASLVVVSRYSVSVLPPASIIVGPTNAQNVTIAVGRAPTQRGDLVVTLAFSSPSLAAISPMRIEFAAGQESATVTLTGLAGGSGYVQLTIVTGDAYAVDGAAPSVVIVPLVTVSLFVQGVAAVGTIAALPDTWLVADAVLSAAVPGYEPIFAVQVGSSTPNTRTAVTVTRITFDSGARTARFSLAVAPVQAALVWINLTAPTHPAMAPAASFVLAVPALPRIVPTGLRTWLRVGAVNALTVELTAFDPPLGALPLRAVLDISECNASIATVAAQSPLEWTRDTLGSVKVVITAQSPGTCRFLARREGAAFGDLVLADTRIDVTRPPQLLVNNQSTNGTTGLFIPFRTAAHDTTTVEARLAGGTFRPGAAALTVAVAVLDVPIPPEADIIVYSAGFADGRQGLVAAGAAGLRAVRDNASIRLSIGPLGPSGYLVLADERLWVTIGAHLFTDGAVPAEASFEVVIGRYAANIVEPGHVIALQAVTNAAVLLAFAAPPAIPLAVTVFRSLVSFDCPAADATSLLLPFGLASTLGDASTVDAASVAGGVASGLAVVFAAGHAFIVAALYAQRSRRGAAGTPVLRAEDSGSALTLQAHAAGSGSAAPLDEDPDGSASKLGRITARFRFPAISFLPLFYVLQFVTHYNGVVVIYAADVGARVGAFLAIAIPIAAAAAILQRIVRHHQNVFVPAPAPKSALKKAARKAHKDAGHDDAAAAGPRGKEKTKAAAVLIAAVAALRHSLGELVGTLRGRVRDQFRFRGRWYHPDPAYRRRYYLIYGEFTGDNRWGLALFGLAAVILGGLDAVRPTTNGGCAGRLLAVCAVHVAMVGVLLARRPFRLPFMGSALIAVHGLLAIAAAVLAQQQRLEIRDDGLVRAALQLVMAAGGVLLGCLVIRLVCSRFEREDHTPPPAGAVSNRGATSTAAPSPDTDSDSSDADPAAAFDEDGEMSLMLLNQDNGGGDDDGYYDEDGNFYSPHHGGVSSGYRDDDDDTQWGAANTYNTRRRALAQEDGAHAARDGDRRAYRRPPLPEVSAHVIPGATVRPVIVAEPSQYAATAPRRTAPRRVRPDYIHIEYDV